MNLKEAVKSLNALTHSVSVLAIELSINSSPARLASLKARLVKLDELLDMLPTEMVSAFYRRRLGAMSAIEYTVLTKAVFDKLEMLLGYTLRNLPKVCKALKAVQVITNRKF